MPDTPDPVKLVERSRVRRLESRVLVAGDNVLSLPSSATILDAVTMMTGHAVFKIEGHPDLVRPIPEVHVVLSVPVTVNAGAPARSRIVVVCENEYEVEAGTHRHVRSIVVGERVLHILEKLT